MKVLGEEIDEIVSDYVVKQPIVEMNIIKKDELKKYNRIYHREYYKKVLSAKIECPLCGSIVGKEKMKVHQKTMKCRNLQNNNFENLD